MTLPLQNIKVLEFTHAIMGPACGLMFADLGAEVIHIEPVEGDSTRRLKGFGLGFFSFYNRNKKSLAIDLKSPEGKTIIYKLVKEADIVIENFGPGTMERLGLGYETLKKLNEKLIYCALKGFLSGPYEKRHALDEVVQMMGGLAYMTGRPGDPLRAGTSIIDITGAMFGFIATMVSLYERNFTGKGKLVKSALFETTAFTMGQNMAYSAFAGGNIPPMPARQSVWSVYRIFESQDQAQVFVGITSDRHWARFCEVFDRADLLANEKLATNNGRIDEHSWLMPDLEAMFKQYTQAEIIAKCDIAEIPFSPIARPEDLFEDIQLNEGKSLWLTKMTGGVEAKLPKLPIEIENTELTLRMNPPEIGEHTQEILAKLGYTKAEIETMQAANIVR
ncbi:MAG: CoA transferase [Microscillaceae bacterium]|jgi:crotonobetainyl-CoA:carnitine CoA-transferase CaiB-like acyl-CoA transferase|nr:CoA transferase [Microscillaceae bacterium]